jgi:cell wall-associated NlpC family hydrolase
VSLLHYTVDQLHEGLPVVPALAVPGDLVLIPGSDPPGPGLPGHVGIYMGDGLVISAVDRQVGVAVQTWQAFTGGGLDAVIDPAPGR